MTFAETWLLFLLAGHLVSTALWDCRGQSQTWGSDFFPALGGCMAFCSVLYTSILKVGQWAILKWKGFCVSTPPPQYHLFES